MGRVRPGIPTRHRALADRQTRCNSGTILLLMKEYLQQIDPDYYRSVQLLIARAEIERERQWRVGMTRRSKIPLGMARTATAPIRSELVTGD
jgi:hypothetical protein